MKDCDDCIMPEMPYCPSCQYGYIVHDDSDYDGYEQPVFCNWECLFRKEDSEVR